MQSIDLLRCWIRILLLQSRPQELPASRVSLILAVVAYGAGDVVLGLQSAGLKATLQAGVLDTALLVIWCGLLLRFRGVWPRFNQTLSALCGSGAFISLAAVPLTRVYIHLPQSAAMLPFLAIALTLVAAWSILVMAHIVRHALEIPLFFALILSGVYFGFAQVLLAVLFPPGH